EKATEMGIDEITPIITNHSERKILKHDRSNTIITAAVKQSLKAYHPILNEAISFTDFLKEIKDEELYIAHLVNEKQQDLKHLYKKSKNVCILIGPEGDFSKKEVAQAQEKGFIAVRMGIERLRTETAAMVACNTIHFIND
ncbi:MAG: RNA methyltransferase, partial [Bacteroidales bacterium]|nr:RNA methyltransferase [Bacteroidales bacterium]